jgi:hypothetical protein
VQEIIKFWLNLISGLFAGVAAYFWLISARVKTPTEFQSVESGKGIGMLQMNEQLSQLGRGVIEQSQKSALAASFASAAAVCQMIAALL